MRWVDLVAAVLGATVSLAAPAAAQAQWVEFEASPETVCADGSRPVYLERVADPARVAFYLEGGGGCWSAETCAFEGPDSTYVSESLATPAWLDLRGGIFDEDDPRNPLRDHSFVYVPYCTGDVHLGNARAAYTSELAVEHRGYPNGVAAVEYLAAQYPEASEVVVVGISAGGVAAPLYAGLVSDALPDARVVSIADSAGAYPDLAALNALVGTLWGTMEALPDWPEVDGLGVREWSIPGLYGVVASHAPDVRFAAFDHAYDEAQTFYGQLAGVDADELLTLIEANDERIEADGADVARFVAAGTGHTVLDRDAIYETESAGVRLHDWLTEFIAGGAPEDVRCVDCR